MKLTDEQNAAVRKWAADGAGLAEIQARLKDEFGIAASFMEVRFLVLDLNATIKDKEEPGKASPAPSDDLLGAKGAAKGDAPGAGDMAEEPVYGPAGADGAEGQEADGAAHDDIDDPGAPVSRNVKVTMDKLCRPGFMMCGEVTFSDGKTGKWGITNDGQIAFEPPDKDYRPSNADIRAFQQELRKTLGY